MALLNRGFFETMVQCAVSVTLSLFILATFIEFVAITSPANQGELIILIMELDQENKFIFIH